MSLSSLHRLPLADARLDEVLAELRANFGATAARHDEQASFPHENFALLHRYGLISQVVPRAYGGAGASLAQASRIVAAVAGGDPATALVLAMTYIHHRAIVRSGSWPEHLRRQVFESAVNDGALINALRVDPDVGTPLRGGLPSTVATLEDGHWRLHGRKLYSTGIPALRWMAVWARTDEPEPRVGNFLVPGPATAVAGLSVAENWNHLGLRASGSHEAVFDGVAIPLENAVDIRAPKDWTSPQAGAADDHGIWLQVLLCSLYDAVARAGFDWIRGFLNERVPGNLGAPLSSLPRAQEHVGEIAALLRTNRILLDHAAASIDEGQPISAADSGLMKFTVTGNAIRALELALQLSGNHGLSRHNPLERHYRDVLCSRIHSPQNDSILTGAGRAVLADAGQPA